ncbi:MAG: peptide-methionine (R)-S-oxide reductase MsrB [Gammaproteobacteria bacterium]|nr:peptide-methionine (R)-S-oxide reductase MsrB [Gammaproteobacteria bacterium]
MNRRNFMIAAAAVVAVPMLASRLRARESVAVAEGSGGKFALSDAEWRDKLSALQYRILREEGTERAWTSDLLKEKREGTYHCVGCDQALFTSETKYDSRTGWPSFFDVIDGAVGTRRDFKLVLPRTEYHCSRCGGHHGHVFNDGPKPTGLRYCNNGAVLRFAPTAD